MYIPTHACKYVMYIYRPIISESLAMLYSTLYTMPLCVKAWAYGLKKIHMLRNVVSIARCSFQWCTCFCCKSNILCRKIHITIRRNRFVQKICIFSTYDCTRKTKCTFQNSVKILSRKNIKILNFLCICSWFLPLKKMGMHTHTSRYTYRPAADT
jgi:hypothetical protein